MYFVEGSNIPIIPQEMYDQAQMLRKKRLPQAGKAQAEKPLSGKVYCGCCGAIYRYKAVNQTNYWVCTKHDEGKNLCSVKPVAETEIFAAFLRLYLVVLVLSNMLVGALQINAIQLCFEVCDVLEYKNHVRTDATVFSVVSFLMKLAAGGAATIAGWGLKLCGFQGMGPVMGEVTQSMANGVAILRFAMPGCLALVAFLLCFLYPIKREEIVQVREALAQRHEAES